MTKTQHVYEQANRYFTEQLHNSSMAKEYLEKRGIGEAEIIKHRLGLAPNNIKGLRENLEQFFDFYAIFSSGLFAVDGTDTVPVFMARITIPIMYKGRIVSYTSRALSADDTVKHKHIKNGMNWLYNSDYLTFPNIIVTESPFDSISFIKAGFPAVSTFGSNLKFANRFSNQKKIYIAFDEDNTVKGKNPGLAFALKFGHEIKKTSQKDVFIVRFPLMGLAKMDANAYLVQSNMPSQDFGRLLASAEKIEEYKKYWTLVKNYKKRRRAKVHYDTELDMLKDIQLSEVIKDYVDEFYETDTRLMCRCCFHEDRSPSFTVHKDTNTFLCRGASCGKHGDVIQFIEYMEDLSFKDACTFLKREYT